MNDLLDARIKRILLYLGDVGSGTPEVLDVLAKRIDVSRQTIWSYRSGHSKPRARTLRLMSKLETELGIGVEI
jgi:transcriptional regulator with XRE-family HTH domain